MATADQKRMLSIRFDNRKWRKGTIYEQNGETELYHVECHFRKPHIILQRTSRILASTEFKGRVTFHCLSSNIDFAMDNCNIKLLSHGILKNGYTFAFPISNGGRMTWKSTRKSKYLELTCLNETAMPAARISLAMFKTKKAATIELIGERNIKEGPDMDVLVLTGLAVLQQRLKTNNAMIDASAGSVAVTA